MNEVLAAIAKGLSPGLLANVVVVALFLHFLWRIAREFRLVLKAVAEALDRNTRAIVSHFEEPQ